MDWHETSEHYDLLLSDKCSGDDLLREAVSHALSAELNRLERQIPLLWISHGLGSDEVQEAKRGYRLLCKVAAKHKIGLVGHKEN